MSSSGSPRGCPRTTRTPRSLPPAYGAFAKIYTDLKPGAGGKIEPATNSHYWWSIWVNAVYGEPADRAQHAGAVLLHAPDVGRTVGQRHR